MQFLRHKARHRRTWRSRVGRGSIFALVIGSGIASLSSVETSARPGQAALATSPSPRAVLDQYCVTCHNEKLRTGGLALDTLEVTRPGANPLRRRR